MSFQFGCYFRSKRAVVETSFYVLMWLARYRPDVPWRNFLRRMASFNTISPVLAMSVFAFAATAHAETIQDWGEAGRWKIRIDSESGNGCFMETSVEDGTIVRFGEVPNRSGGFFAIYNSEWTDIVVGEEASVMLEFDAKQFSGNAIGDARDGVPGGYAFFNNPNVRGEFSRSRTMIIHGDKGHTASVDLSGTSKAVQAVEACQKQQTK